MKRFLIGLVILVGVIAAVTVVMRRRSGSELDEWESTVEDTFSSASDAASETVEAATDAASKAAGDARDAVA